MTDGVWVVRLPAECEGVQGNSANPKEGEVMFFVGGWDEWGVRAGRFLMVDYGYGKVNAYKAKPTIREVTKK